jgi:hypothetical protein
MYRHPMDTANFRSQSIFWKGAAMLDYIGRTQLDELLASEGGPHVSIFLPVHAAAIDTRQDQLRLKNLIQRAQKELESEWMPAAQVRPFLAPISRALEDPDFWSNRDNGLAIYLSERAFHALRMNLELEEHLAISRRFYLRPIVGAIGADQRGYLLTLSENLAELYEIQEREIRRLSVPNMPRNMEETLNYTSVDRGQQAHSGSAVHGGKRSEVFHGQGGQPDTHREDLLHYFRAVDEAVRHYLGDSKDPLILACVDASVPVFHHASDSPALCPEHISGNPDYSSPTQLHRESLSILRGRQRDRRLQLAAQVREHMDTSVASRHPNEIIRGAHEGRIRVLFFATDGKLFGRYDAASRETIFEATPSGQLHPYEHDMIELAIEETLRHRGEVHPVHRSEMPAPSPLAALLRY